MNKLDILRADWFRGVLSTFERIAIAGGPRSGKTALSGVTLDMRPVIHSDDFKDLEWSASSQALCDAVNAVNGPVVVEGVAVPRALRKGMKVDAVIWVANPNLTSDGADSADGEQLKPGQFRMCKACMTVLAEWWARPDSKLVTMLSAPEVKIEAPPLPEDK